MKNKKFNDIIAKGESMKLIIGLGNPGKKYEHTRHNMGFDTLDKIAELLAMDIDIDDFHGVYGKKKIEDEDIILFKPGLFMNLSGQPTSAIMHYFKIDVADIVVIYDDMAIPSGKIRMRMEGSSGGHKGIQSIIDYLKTEDIKRIRIGIGEPIYNSIDFVLTKPQGDEAIAIDQAQDKAVKAIREYLLKGFEYSMSRNN